jgi:hypothetical protein
LLLLVNFPNEAEGTDHLHLRLDTFEEAIDWIKWARLHYGESIAAIGDHLSTSSECPLCEKVAERGDF